MLGALLQPLRVKLVINNLLKWMIERYNGKKSETNCIAYLSQLMG